MNAIPVFDIIMIHISVVYLVCVLFDDKYYMILLVSCVVFCVRQSSTSEHIQLYSQRTIPFLLNT